METMKQIPIRENIPTEDKWALEDLYPGDADWNRELETLSQDKAYLTSFAGKLGSSAQMLYQYLDASEKLNVKADRLGNYCMRKADEDTRDATAQAMQGQFMSVVVELSAACSFDTPEIMAISEETLDGFYAEYPKLERYRRYLTDLRRKMSHTLSASEEKLLAAAGEMAQTPDTIYGALADADLTFRDAVDAHGNAHPLTQGTFVQLEESPDRALRKSAYESLYDGFTAFQNTAAAILNGQNKQLKFYADDRKYASALEASLDSTNVPVSVYDNLIKAVHEKLPSMHRYVRLRKKLLGVEELHFYDVYTPLLPGVDKHIPYEQAKQTVYDALAPLGEDYRAILKEGFDHRWIDVYQNQGKRSGAYSAGAAVHPYVLLNYTGTLDSQFTLAHEMGHALHSYLSNKHQNPIDANYVIFVAEVASTCNEALLMEHLLKDTTDKKERAYLINHFLDQFKGTIYRQTMFAEFELWCSEQTQKGEALTAEALSNKYLALNRDYYGPDIVLDDEIALEWARIPHFYYDFYVYQYATGFSAAIALSQRILREGKPAVDDYLGFLKGGCSADPISLLRGAGVDMATPAPTADALRLFDELVSELEELTR